MDVRCDKWKSGLCAAVEGLYCPVERAIGCGPADCCHHPGFPAKESKERSHALLVVMRREGVKLERYGVEKLRDPAFVDRLYEAFKRIRSKRIASSKGSSIS